MLILLLSIFVTLIIIGAVFWKKSNGFDGGILLMIGITGAIIFGVATLATGICVSEGMIIDDKINLYEIENSKIDKQIYSIVENYKGYEQKTFKSIKNKNTNTLISLYPELKSDSLVKEQIKTYNSNRKQIIKLKQNKLEQKPLRWWLYFGT